MTWPERLDLILAILAQVPWSWVIASMIAGVAFGVALVILAAVVVISSDARRRDAYYEDYVGGNHNEI